MHKPLVMIVEDEPRVRDELVGLATQVGFRTVEAGDGEEALQLLNEHTPDLLVTDLHMPGLGGRQLVGLMRRMPGLSDLPIMVVTADSRRSTKIELLEAGADDFIGKPVDPQEFLARMRAMGRHANLLGQLGVVTIQRDRATQQLEARNRELEQLTMGLVAALEKANSLNDSDTGNHIRRVCAYASLLGEVKGCDAAFIDRLSRYAGLHDVGKVGIRDGILKKPGKLTEDEFEEMKTHTLIGGELLRAAGLPPIAIHIAQHHHERWDGSGYPHGLSGEAIPLEARIVAVVDVFDALVSERCYKRAFSFQEAQSEMFRSSGTHLDPGLVTLFFDHTDRIGEISSRYVDEPTLRNAWA